MFGLDVKSVLIGIVIGWFVVPFVVRAVTSKGE